LPANGNGTHLKTPKLDDKNSSLHFSILAKNIISQKYGQIVPTPRGSILHHTKPSQKPYNAKIVVGRKTAKTISKSMIMLLDFISPYPAMAFCVP